MSPITYVGIAEYKILEGTGTLACSALGSCVGVCLWDYETKLTGLLHILLPSTSEATDKSNPAKFADLGVAKMVRDMEARGASRRRLRAKLAGGACLYQYERTCSASEIGERNIAAARAALAKLGIPVIAEHVGGVYGRSIRLDPQSFELRVNVLAHDSFVI